MKFEHTILCLFKFVCDQRWEELETMPGYSQKRFCKECQKMVYLTRDYDQLKVNIEKENCVALIAKNPTGGDFPLMGFVTAPIIYKKGVNYADKPDGIIFRSIDELELTIPIANKLHKHNIKIIGDLVHCSKEKLKNEFAINTRHINEIIEVLATRNLVLGMIIDDWEAVSQAFRVDAK